MDSLNLALRNPDISTARQIAEAINELVGTNSAVALDPGTVSLSVPELYEDNVVGLLADVEQVLIEPDQPARIVIDESSGTIVMGENVRIDTIAVAQGNLIVNIKQRPTPSEFNPVTRSRSDAPWLSIAILRPGSSLTFTSNSSADWVVAKSPENEVG